MKIPFKYGCAVEGEYFCPRPELERQLREYAESGQNLVIQGERRMGKTSLVKKAISGMKRELNLEQLRFHVLEAKTELDELLLAIDHAYALGEPVAQGGKWDLPDKPFAEWMLHGSLYHAYHHLNFAWNARFKTADQAESQFDRYEKFPRREFERYWPKSALKKKQKDKK